MSDDLVSDDPGPGELVKVGAANAAPEHSPVLPGLVELAEVPGDYPARRLVRVADLGPPESEPPQVAVQRAERLGGYLRPVII